MGRGNDVIAFRNGVVSETDCYVGSPEAKHSALVLVPEHASTRTVFDLAHANDMVCTHLNTLSADTFAVELTFDHVHWTDLGGSDDD